MSKYLGTDGFRGEAGIYQTLFIKWNPGGLIHYPAYRINKRKEFTTP